MKRKNIRSIIIEALQTINQWIAADDLYIHLRSQRIPIGYSTLYKHLRSMRDAHDVLTQTDQNKTLYLLSA